MVRTGKPGHPLRRVPWLASMSDKELVGLTRFLDVTEIPVGRVLVTEGEVGREVYVVIDGTAEVTIAGEPSGTLGAGEIVGEMSMLEHRPRVATVRAVTPMTVAVVGREAWADFSRRPSIALAIAKQLSGRLRQLEQA